jgi:hypothetical protein
MKKYLIIVFWLLSIKVYSQSKVVYIIPDSVEVAIKKQISKLKHNSADAFIYFLLEKNKGGIYSLSLFRDPARQGGLMDKILKLTNRVLLIDEDKYPLMFDYDFTFSTPKETKIGSIGNREGNVVRSTALFHGYTIFFNTSGKIIKVSDY